MYQRYFEKAQKTAELQRISPNDPRYVDFIVQYMEMQYWVNEQALNAVTGSVGGIHKGVSNIQNYIKHGTYNNMRNTIGEKGTNLFINAMNKGLVGATNQSGIKMLSGQGVKIGNTYYQYEVKLLDKNFANYRLYGNFDKDLGTIVFTTFGKALH